MSRRKKRHTEKKRKKHSKGRGRKKREEQRMLRNLGREIANISKDIIENPSLIEAGKGWGNPLVTIGKCDGSCDSIFHKQFIVFILDGDSHFHCDHDELLGFIQTKNFVQLGKFALAQGEKEFQGDIGRSLCEVSREIVNYPTLKGRGLGHET
jgi:hypothetical protein